jgi:hypothetical protein
VGGIIGKLCFERDQTLAHPVLEQTLDAAWHRGAAALRAALIGAGHVIHHSGDDALIAHAHYAVCLAARRHLDAALTGHGVSMLWSERRPEPGPGTEAERFSIYTRRFARRVLDAPPAAPVPWSDSLAMAGRLGLAAGIRLHFPHTDPRLVALAATARPTEGYLLRTFVARHADAPLEYAFARAA